jgi:hypothetical protein
VARLAALAVLLAAVLGLAGCGGTTADRASSTTVPCDDTAFRAQDEELYVTKTAVANALAGGGDPSLLLRDLRQARRTLGSYLDAHPPCDDALQAIASTEGDALAAIDRAITTLAGAGDARSDLSDALTRLREAQASLAPSG